MKQWSSETDTVKQSSASRRNGCGNHAPACNSVAKCGSPAGLLPKGRGKDSVGEGTEASAN
eukprot:1016490-Pyramimonas_sp.AAC.1